MISLVPNAPTHSLSTGTANSRIPTKILLQSKQTLNRPTRPLHPSRVPTYPAGLLLPTPTRRDTRAVEPSHSPTPNPILYRVAARCSSAGSMGSSGARSSELSSGVAAATSAGAGELRGGGCVCLKVCLVREIFWLGYCNTFVCICQLVSNH
jgi:hypothetical protein